MRCRICRKRKWFGKEHKGCTLVEELRNEAFELDYKIEFCIKMLEHLRNFKTLQGFTEVYDKELEEMQDLINIASGDYQIGG